MIKLTKAGKRARKLANSGKVLALPSVGLHLTPQKVSMDMTTTYRGGVVDVEAPVKRAPGAKPLGFQLANGQNDTTKHSSAKPGPSVNWKSCGSGVVYTPPSKASMIRRHKRLRYYNVVTPAKGQGDVRLIEANR